MLKTFTHNEIEAGKKIAIAAHLTIVGCIIAIFMNMDLKNKYAGFYIKQAFGIHLVFFMFSYTVGAADSWMVTVPFYLCFFILWVYSFTGAINGEINVLPKIGLYFQKWFDKLSA